ncbi:MAG: hypothetical protein Fur0037_25750 [Planctomycetota bacterium]
MSYRDSFFPTLTPAIRLLLIANAAVFAANLVLGGALSASPSGHFFALTWDGLFDGYGLGLLRLVTASFTHDYFSASHFVFNMVGLYLFGHVVEGALGFRGTLKFYVSASLSGWVLHLVLMGLSGHQNVATFGASGVVFAAIVFAACLMPRARTLFYLEMRVLAAILVGIGAYQALIEMREGFGDGVAHGGHLGGALFGFLCFRRGWLRDYRGGSNPIAALRKRLRDWRAQRVAGSLAAEERRLDEILAKVKEEGLQSLSGEERRFLDRRSRKGRKS